MEKDLNTQHHISIEEFNKIVERAAEKNIDVKAQKKITKE